MRRAGRIELERPREVVRLTGKTVVVTGGSSGIGLGAAKALRRTGADVVVVVREERAAARARASVATAGGVGTVEAFSADLASRAEVERLGAKLDERFPELYGLVHSAGLRLPEREEGPDGSEPMFAVELLAPFLLTNRLLDSLRAGAPSRVVVISGEIHRRGPGAPRGLDPENLQAERTFRPGAHAAHLALAKILLVQELGRRLEGSGVTALTVAPGPTRTRLFRHYPSHRKAVARLGLLLRRAQEPEEAGVQVAHALTDPELAGAGGAYLLEGRTVVPAPPARSREAAGALWEYLEGDRYHKRRESP